MCYQGKCLICIPVKTGCLVLAILNAIGTGLVLLGSAISGVMLAAGAKYAQNMGGPVSYLFMFFGGAVGTGILLTGVFSLITFIFYVLLCNGICKRRPGQVKVYFIFGVTITVLGVLIAMGYIIISFVLPAPGIILLIHCVFHALFLRLVHQTYFVLLEEAAPKHNIPPTHTNAPPQRPTYPSYP